MTGLKTRRRLVPGLTLLAGLLIAVPLSLVTVVHALPCCDIDEFYYSDDTFSDWIGEHVIDCSGNHYDWGTVNDNNLRNQSTRCDNGIQETFCIIDGYEQNCP
jgi:hypothetical protein